MRCPASVTSNKYHWLHYWYLCPKTHHSHLHPLVKSPLLLLVSHDSTFTCTHWKNRHFYYLCPTTQHSPAPTGKIATTTTCAPRLNTQLHPLVKSPLQLLVSHDSSLSPCTHWYKKPFLQLVPCRLLLLSALTKSSFPLIITFHHQCHPHNIILCYYHRPGSLFWYLA